LLEKGTEEILLMNRIEEVAKMFGVERGEEFAITTTERGRLLGYKPPSDNIYMFDTELVRKGFDDGWSPWYGGNEDVLYRLILGIYKINDDRVEKVKEMKNYLTSTGLYKDDADMFYEEEMIRSDKTIPISELVERFVDTDKEYKGEPWNIKQILSNINMIIPVEDREL
jgi:hypothetical protein